MAACIADVRLLCNELERAITALAENDLEKLSAGVAAQEDLADKLHAWVQRYQASPGTKGKYSHPAPSELATLNNLLRTYSGLLQRSTRTANVRLALCRTYQQPGQDTTSSSARSAGRSWWCEV